MSKITFGTDGWRARMDEDFTFDNVKVVAQAVANYVKDHNLEEKGIVVGYDTRWNSDKFAEEVCKVMLGNQIGIYMTSRDVPTPVAAYMILHLKTGGAIVITASHNPPEWNGLKFIPEYAGPALPDVTDEITKNIHEVSDAGKVSESSIEEGTRRHLFEKIDPSTLYIEFVEKQTDMEAVREAKLRVVFDSMHGAAREYVDRILRDAGCDVTVLHGNIDSTFGGHRPEPLPEFLNSLKIEVLRLKAHLGLATDGDADRATVYDSNGAYLAANQLFPILYDYMVKSSNQGGIVRSLSTTHLADRIAESLKLPVYEVPVGFKYVGQYLREKDVVIGAEESGGISFKGHISEKDGIFTSVKAVEMRAKTGKSLSQLLDDVQSRYGLCIAKRDIVACPEDKKQTAMQRLESNLPDEIAGIAILSVNKMDGLKFLLKDGGWILIRPSGTEPWIRIYAESGDEKTVNTILKHGKELASKALSS